MTGLVDTHCHLDHIEADPADVLEEAAAAGVERVVDIGMGLASSEGAVVRAEASGGRVAAAVGFHPNELEGFSEEGMQRLRDLAARPSVVAVGETGLDFYRDRSAPELQERAFRAHIELAREVGKALVIHCRDAHDRVLEVLDDAGAPGLVVMHCFSGDVAHARACVERGYVCSFAGNLTYPRNTELREAARILPEELLLVETDAPFLAPVPYRGKPNRPALVVHTAAALAEARGISDAALREVLARNVARVFGG